MTAPGSDELLDAVRRAFTGGSGAPAATEVRPLTPAEARTVLGGHVAVAVTKPAVLARLVPGREITAAMAVTGEEHDFLVYATERAVATLPAVAAAIEAATTHLAGTVRRLRGEAAVLDALHSTGRRLTARLDIDRIVQDATDAATRATGAEFGAFFYNLINELGESYTLSGVPRAAFARFPMPRNTDVFAPTFDGAGTVRSPDITKDPRGSELSRSMLPVAPPTPGLDVVTRYLPAATGSKVGGDWFDVIRLPSGGTAFVIGDVVGHGVTAATVMGQVRTAIRCYALLELPPSEVLRNVSALTGGLFGESFVTCFYAVHRPDEGTLTYANAGHLPAIPSRPGSAPEQIGEALAQPLGAGAEFPEQVTRFPPGADLVLYTDGLVESRTRDLTLGVEWLLAGIPALIHVRHRGEDGA